MIFEVTQEHITLLRNANVRYNDYCEFGAPEIDPKRPYGNSDVHGDIAELLDLEPGQFMELEDLVVLEDGDLPSEMREYLDAVHRETETALQIFLSTGKMEVGVYESEWPSGNWKKVEEQYHRPY